MIMPVDGADLYKVISDIKDIFKIITKINLCLYYKLLEIELILYYYGYTDTFT